YRAQLDVDSGAATVVGVNRFAAETTGPPMATLTIDPEIERQQIERVCAVRASRSDDDWREARAAVSAAARNGDNLVPAIVAAVEARATVGEIADSMRDVFGEYKESSSL
ncbi:MAG TPA: methylmalonyl-CoA mutase family protein, partial [Vicinamibacterales bacterium]|nr:methylmalonyl-CoA mutase family protein [Vicinamibacterales bacterium]